MPADSRGIRLSVMGIVVMSLFLVLMGRLWYLQVMEAPAYERVAVANQVRVVQIPPMRGRILDSAGRVLADNKRSLSVTVDRAAIKRTSARAPLFERLAGVLGVTPDALEKRYTSELYDPFLPLPLADDVDESVAVFLKERREDYPGVEVVEGWQRVYRYAPLASHLIGYVGKIPAEQKDEYRDQGYLLSDTVGRNGVEQTYEHELRGKPGYLRFEVDAKNRIVQVLERQDPIPGNDVQLSIDLRLQQWVEMVLQRGLQEARTRVARPNSKFANPGYFSAPAGAVVVQDPRDGSILAMATNPTYDNRWFVGGLPNAKFQQLFPDGERSPLVNRAISGRYQLGSTMKLFTSMAALNSGFLPNPNYTIVDTGTYELENCPPGQKCVYSNSGNLMPGAINMPAALVVSSDVYYYKIGAEMWVQRKGNVLQDEVAKFGLGTKSGIDLPSEYGGIVPTKEVKAELAKRGAISEEQGRGYYTGDNIQLAIGQGLLVATPLQLANGYSAFANGGTLWTPQVAEAVWAPGAPDTAGQVDLSRATLVRRIEPVAAGTVPIDPAFRQQLVQGLIGVVRNPEGTAHDAYRTYDWAAFPIAGKTGTAQDFTQNPAKDTSLFAAFGPVRQGEPPRFTVAAVLEKAGYGAWAAAPVTKCIFQAISGATPLPDVQPADLLDRTSTKAADLPDLPEDLAACLVVPNTGRD